MPGISRDSGTDSAGGPIIEGSPDVFANNDPAVRIGDAVEGHGPGPHAAPVMEEGNGGEVYANNILVCHQGNKASCGDPATGSNNVFVHDLAARAAQELGFPRLIIQQELAGEILDGRVYERSLGVEPDTVEATEYGDGGIATQPGGESNRFDNTSPVTGESGPIPTTSVATDTPSSQPSNENGEYIQWLPHVDSRVLPEVVRKLEALSQAVGYQLVITSGYRSPEYNSNVGGVRLSEHQTGKAVDIVQSGLTIAQRQEFLQAAIDVGFTGIGVYPTFCHVDIGAFRAWGDPNSRRHLYKFPWAQEVLGANGYATS